MGKKKNRSRKRKQRFYGNHFTATTSKENQILPDNISSSRSKKISLEKVLTETTDDDINIIINFNILKVFQMYACCPECNGSNIAFVNCSEQRMGFSYKIAINCKDFPFEHFFYTSKELINKSRGHNSFDIIYCIS